MFLQSWILFLNRSIAASYSGVEIFRHDEIFTIVSSLLQVQHSPFASFSWVHIIAISLLFNIISAENQLKWQKNCQDRKNNDDCIKRPPCFGSDTFATKSLRMLRASNNIDSHISSGKSHSEEYTTPCCLLDESHRHFSSEHSA